MKRKQNERIMKEIKIKNADTYLEIQKQFIIELKSYITPGVNMIITNGNLASILIDLSNYKIDSDGINNEISGKEKLYNMGKLDEICIMVDPYMLWSDDRIIFRNDNIIIDEILIIDETTCRFL